GEVRKSCHLQPASSAAAELPGIVLHFLAHRMELRRARSVVACGGFTRTRVMSKTPVAARPAAGVVRLDAPQRHADGGPEADAAYHSALCWLRRLLLRGSLCAARIAR